MNQLIKIYSIVLLIIFLPLAIQAQKTTTAKTPANTVSDSSAYAPKNKMEKTQADADNYIKAAEAAKNRFKTLFPSKPGDTVYAVIAGINYTDPNLKLLKQKLDDIKSTKGITSTYRNGTAIIKILYKGGDASKLYDNLGDEIKELFLPEDIEGTRMILNYKLATSTEGTAEKKVKPGNN